MSKHEARITKEATGSYYAVIVRIDKVALADQVANPVENVIYGYEGRHFATRKNAERSTQNYMKKHGLI